MIDGGIEAGPNAVLQWLEKIQGSNINVSELLESLSYKGFRKFIYKHPLTPWRNNSFFIKNVFVKVCKINSRNRPNMIERGLRDKSTTYEF